MKKLIISVFYLAILFLSICTLSGCDDDLKEVDQDDKISLVFDYVVTEDELYNIQRDMKSILTMQGLISGYDSSSLISEKLGDNVVVFYLPAESINKQKKEQLGSQFQQIEQEYNQYLFDEEHKVNDIYTLSFDTDFLSNSFTLDNYLNEVKRRKDYQAVAKPYLKHYESDVTMGDEKALTLNALKFYSTKFCAVELKGAPKINYKILDLSTFLFPDSVPKSQRDYSLFLTEKNAILTDSSGKIDKFIKEKPESRRVMLVSNFLLDSYRQRQTLDDTANVYFVYDIITEQQIGYSRAKKTCPQPPEFLHRKPYSQQQLHHLIGYQFDLYQDHKKMRN